MGVQVPPPTLKNPNGGKGSEAAKPGFVITLSSLASQRPADPADAPKADREHTTAFLLRLISSNAVLVAAYAYGVSWLSATIFYSEFGVRPEEVGLGWTELVSQSLVVLAAYPVVASLLIWHSRLRDRALYKGDTPALVHKLDPLRYMGAKLPALLSNTLSTAWLLLFLTAITLGFNLYRGSDAIERVRNNEPVAAAFGLHAPLPRVSLKVIGDDEPPSRRMKDDEPPDRQMDDDDKEPEETCVTLLGSSDGQTVLWHAGDPIRVPTDLTMIYEPCFD